MVHLVIIHGRAQEFAVPVELHDSLERALRWGLERARAKYAQEISISFAFYGDLWRPDAGDVERTYLERPTPIEESIATDILAHSTYNRPISVEVERLGWNTFTDLIGQIDRRTRIGEVALRTFLRDVAIYFDDEELRMQAMERVASAVRNAEAEVILIGRSFGSVVGYDFLRQQPGLPVRGFLTFGSPLGFHTIQTRLASSTKELDFPKGLRRWVNVYDRRDFVSGSRKLGPIYRRKRSVKRVEDVESRGRPPSIFNLASSHDARVYLSSIALGKAVRSLVEYPVGSLTSTERAARHSRDEARGEIGADDEIARVAQPDLAAYLPQSYERTASADFPPIVAPGSSHFLRYEVGDEGVFPANALMKIETSEDIEQLELTVAVQATDFSVLDPETREIRDTAQFPLRLGEPQEGFSGEFLLSARTTDRKLNTTIHVRFLHGNNPAGRIDLPTIIAPGGATGPSPAIDTGRSAKLRFNPSSTPDPDVMLFISRHSDNAYEISATLLGRSHRRVFNKNLGTLPITGEAWTYARSILEQFRATRELPKGERKQRVDSLGLDLWRKMPEGFQRFYWDDLHGKELTIAMTSEEPYIPWELIKPEKAPGGQTAEMLGLAFSMARWKDGRELPNPIVVSDFFVVAPHYPSNPIPSADHEANDLVQLLNAKRIDPGKRTQVIKLLKSVDLQVLHFAGHGHFGSSPMDSRLRLSDNFLDTFDVNGARLSKEARRPLVFLNACEVAQHGWSLTEIGGWAEAFCEAGSSAFVGPYWAVNDQVARKVALTFYQALHDGDTVGNAIRKVRRRFVEDSEFRYHPTWLAYTLHCHPNVAVTFPNHSDVEPPGTSETDG